MIIFGFTLKPDYYKRLLGLGVLVTCYIRFETLNVRGANNATKAQIEKWMKAKRIDILAIQETKIAGSKRTLSSN